MPKDIMISVNCRHLVDVCRVDGFTNKVAFRVIPIINSAGLACASKLAGGGDKCGFVRTPRAELAIGNSLCLDEVAGGCLDGGRIPVTVKTDVFRCFTQACKIVCLN